MIFHVKLRTKGEKGWWFLSDAGRCNRLRVHAVMIPDRLKADRIAAELERENAHIEAKVTT